MTDAHMGAEPGKGDALEEGDRHEGTGESSDTSGTSPAPTTEREPPETDPAVKDAGPPAEGPADPEGSSGAEQGLNPLAPESYGSDPQGPTTSTEE